MSKVPWKDTTAREQTSTSSLLSMPGVVAGSVGPCKHLSLDGYNLDLMGRETYSPDRVGSNANLQGWGPQEC